jgi:hypothetical protein
VHDACGSIVEVWLSAHSGEGVGLLRDAIAGRIVDRDRTAGAVGAQTGDSSSAHPAPGLQPDETGSGIAEAAAGDLHLNQRELRNILDAI